MFGHVLAATVTGRNRQQHNSENSEQENRQKKQLLLCFVFRLLFHLQFRFSAALRTSSICVLPTQNCFCFEICLLFAANEAWYALPAMHTVYNLDSLISLCLCNVEPLWRAPSSFPSLYIYEKSILVSCTNFSQLQTSMGKFAYHFRISSQFHARDTNDKAHS